MKYLFVAMIGCLVRLTAMGQGPSSAVAFDVDSIVAAAAARGMGSAGTPQVKLVSRQFSFTEGASVDRRGNIFFTDQPNDKI